MIFVHRLGFVHGAEDQLRREELSEADQPLDEDEDVDGQGDFAVGALESCFGVGGFV